MNWISLNCTTAECMKRRIFVQLEERENPCSEFGNYHKEQGDICGP